MQGAGLVFDEKNARVHLATLVARLEFETQDHLTTLSVTAATNAMRNISPRAQNCIARSCGHAFFVNSEQLPSD